MEMNKFTVVRKVLRNNYQSCNLIGHYPFWVISPRNSTSHFTHVNSEQQSMTSDSVLQTNHSKLQSCWTCTPSTHLKTVYHQPSKCNLYLQVYFWVDNILLNGQSVTCTCGFGLQSDWYRQSKALEVDTFSHGCYQALSSPHFWGEPGDEARKHPAPWHHKLSLPPWQNV